MTENDTQITGFVSQLPNGLQDKWQSAGFGQATDIQIETFQPMYDAQSVIASAPTGSGKTLAYLLPVLSRMVAEREAS
ncbi:MAG TPA: DEAD/DEAH box helicase, partial [Aerococcus urinaeequi]|nr:DEAD/DEAH box helicase [Aerococcus urinaeequi]